MKRHVKVGLIAGAIGLVVNVVVSAMVGLCGPVVALVVGAIAGVLAVSQTLTAPKTENAKVGAVAAAIAGALTQVGQLIGGLGVLFAAQALDLPLLVGEVPTSASEQLGYWMGGLLAGGCFGAVGLVFAVGGGALAAYLRSKPVDTAYQPAPSAQ